MQNTTAERGGHQYATVPALTLIADFQAHRTELASIRAMLRQANGMQRRQVSRQLHEVRDRMAVLAGELRRRNLLA